MAVAREHPAQQFWGQWSGQTLPQVPLIMAAGAGLDSIKALGLKGIPRVLAMSGLGALEGAAAGGVTPTQDQQYGRNVALGGIIGGTLPFATKAAGSAFRGVRSALQAGTESGQQKIAGRVLQDAVKDAPIPDANPNVPGFKPSLGQATNNPEVLQLERAMQGRSLDEPLLMQQHSNNAAITDALGTTANDVSPQAASAEAKGALKAEQMAARAAENQAWSNIPADTTFPTGPLKQSVTQYIEGLPKAYKRLVPSDVQDMLGSLSDKEPLPELQAARSTVGELQNQARVAGEANKARILGDIQSKIDDVIHGQSEGAGSKDFQGAYNAAMDASRDYHARFSQDPVRTVLAAAKGGDKVQASQALQRILKPHQPEAVKALSNALGDSQEGRQAVRDYLTGTMRQYGSLAAQDASGNPMLSSAKLGKFMDQHADAIKEFYTPEQQDLLKRVRQASEMNDRTMRAGSRNGGSDTAAKLNKGLVLDHLAHGLFGLGGLPGKILAQGMGGVLGESQTRIDRLLAEGLADPEFAKVLMKKATPGTVGQALQRLKPAATGAARLGIYRHLSTSGGGSTIQGAPIPGWYAPYAASTNGQPSNQ